MADRKRYWNHSVARGMRVLELFESGREEMTLSQIARNMDTAPSGIYAIVSTLEELGCLIRNPETKQYRLGLKILELASRLIGSLDIRDEAKATLRRLAADHRANSHLAVLFDGEVLYIDTEIAAATFVLPEIIGRRAPSYCTALGKALLAHNPDAADRVFASEPFRAMTPRTITTADKLRRQLLQVVERGHAVDREEFHEGLVCIAAPIRNFRGEVVAALSISVAATRLKQEALSGFVESVMRGAREVSERMGLATV